MDSSTSLRSVIYLFVSFIAVLLVGCSSGSSGDGEVFEDEEEYVREYKLERVFINIGNDESVDSETRNTYDSNNKT